MQKLTQRFVTGLRPGPSDQVIFDSDLQCFGVRVKPSGVKSWLVQYRNQHGQSRRMTLGKCNVLTPDQARARAKQVLGLVTTGADPASERNKLKGAATVAELCDQYLQAGKNTIKASTLAMDKSRIERHVKPLLGARAVTSLTRADLEKFLSDVIAGKSTPKGPGRNAPVRGGKISGGPGVASRTLGMLGTILERAVAHGLLSKNPCRGIARPKDKAKIPVFSLQRVSAFGKAIKEAQGENELGLRALRVLLTTGCRRSEILSLQWGSIDATAQCFRLVDTKSGPQSRPVAKSAIDYLLAFKPDKAKPNDFVFPSTSKTGHLIGLPRILDRITTKAKIDDLSLHGLRHWFASAAAELNFSELVIAGLLGHTVKGVTARYANAPDSALLAAANAVAAHIEAHLI